MRTLCYCHISLNIRLHYFFIVVTTFNIKYHIVNYRYNCRLFTRVGADIILTGLATCSIKSVFGKFRTNMSNIIEAGELKSHRYAFRSHDSDI